MHVASLSLKYCCPICFSNSYIKEKIRLQSKSTGTCSFCMSEGQKLLDPSELDLDFSPIISLYEHNSEGSSLEECLSKDWKIFSSELKLSKINLLLREILKKTHFPHGCLLIRNYASLVEDAKKEWNFFSKELKHCNRFFISKELERLHSLNRILNTFCLDGIPEKVFRARKSDNSETIPIKEMGKPPAEKTKDGRGNPIGISYCYVATSPNVAIHEVRPDIGDYVCVAVAEFTGNMRIIDLRNSAQVSPFELQDDLEVISSAIPFLRLLGGELSKPIPEKNRVLDYLPTQYLCEAMKNQGFDGVAYESSATTGSSDDGFNILLFDDNKIKFSKVDIHKITHHIVKWKTC